MRRREFIAAVASVAAWPVLGHAQQPALPIIGFLRDAPLGPAAHRVDAFRQGLREAGFADGQNVTIELRSAENQADRLPSLAAELIRRPVAVLVANSPAAVAAKAATTTVPVVFATGSDPVRDGLVASLNRPTGNVTGVVFFNALLGPKRLDLLRQVAPRATIIAMLVNPNSPNTEAERKDVHAAALAIGQQLMILDVSSESDFEIAFEKFVQRGAGALLVGSGAFLNSHHERIITLAARYALPAIYVQREAAVRGGLISYGPSINDAYRQAGIYAGRILKGESPGDLPVIRSTKFEFVLNLKIAKALGLELPPTLLAIADEVIE